jgi:large subunit ribosomal protein L28
VTKRRWNPNLRQVHALVQGSPKTIKACTACIRSGKVIKVGKSIAKKG